MENALTLDSLLVKYLAWCGKHRAPRSTEWYEGYIRSFRAHLGEDVHMPAMSLKPFHIVEWIDSHGEAWGDNYKGGAIISIKRVYNWALELGYIESSPVAKLKKPQAKRREIYMKNEDYEAVLGQIAETDPFRDLVIFVWQTGCRPQEVRHIERRHVDLANERIVFPAEESKGKRSKRIIYIQGAALEIITRLMEKDGEGKLFLNTRGLPWTKFAICNRYYRISQAIGKRMFCYAARHGFATRKLIQGHDAIVISRLMGHTDATMLSRVYAHVDKDTDFLKRALAE